MNRRQIICIVMLACATALTLLLEREPSVQRVHHLQVSRIPLVLGDWQGSYLSDDVSRREQLSEELGTEDHLMRDYVKGPYRVQFAAVFAENDRRAAHPPEQCYRGHGLNLVGKTRLTYPIQWPLNGYQPGEHQIVELGELGEPIEFAVQELIVAKGDHVEVVHYWFKTGNRVTSTFVRHEINMFLNAFAEGGRATNSLVRISSQAQPPTPEGIETARRNVQEFAQKLFPYTIAAMP